MYGLRTCQFGCKARLHFLFNHQKETLELKQPFVLLSERTSEGTLSKIRLTHLSLICIQQEGEIDLTFHYLAQLSLAPSPSLFMIQPWSLELWKEGWGMKDWIRHRISQTSLTNICHWNTSLLSLLCLWFLVHSAYLIPEETKKPNWDYTEHLCTCGLLTTQERERNWWVYDDMYVISCR